MSIKGAAVKSTKEFIQKNHPEHYNNWLKGLSKASQDIISKPILATKWYPIDKAILEPTELTCKMFFNSVKEGAWELGRFSAEQGLSGIYKVFLLISSPQFIVSRAAKVFESYYENSEIEVKEESKSHVVLQINKFPTPDPIMDYRIAGWIQRALEKAGSKTVKVDIKKSLAKGDSCTEICTTWSN
jgi:hypothetical protein